MNTSVDWFKSNHEGSSTNILVHPANQHSAAATLRHKTKVMTPEKLSALAGNFRSFFQSFEIFDWNDLPKQKISELLKANRLDPDDFKTLYSEDINKAKKK